MNPWPVHKPRRRLSRLTCAPVLSVWSSPAALAADARPSKRPAPAPAAILARMIEGPEGLKRVGALHVNSLSFPFSNPWRPGPAPFRARLTIS